MILEDIGQPKIKDVAKALGVTERTVYRWLNEPETPRIAALALWWLTRWGMSEINCTLVDTNNLFRQYVHALIEENHQLKEEINRLSSIAMFGSANDPTELGRATLRAEPQRPVLVSTKELVRHTLYVPC